MLLSAAGGQQEMRIGKVLNCGQSGSGSGQSYGGKICPFRNGYITGYEMLVRGGLR